MDSITYHYEGNEKIPIIPEYICGYKKAEDVLRNIIQTWVMRKTSDYHGFAIIITILIKKVYNNP